MSRPSKEIRADLDELNRKRVALHNQIEERRAALAEMNAKVPPLEREYQAAVAAEAQAAAQAQSQTQH